MNGQDAKHVKGEYNALLHFLLVMFEAFGFSGVPSTLQKLISATFERGHFGG
jgi:hypothetical protein